MSDDRATAGAAGDTVAPGTLYGVGVGPGDPELMTVKAVKLLAAVPVIAYPAPESGESSARRIAACHIPQGRTEIAIRVPMRPGSVPSAPYDDGAAEIGRHLAAGRDVAVLCEGDPLFYGSFIYLHQRLLTRFGSEIIPGISSLMACAAVAEKPLVARDDALTVIPATLPDEALRGRLSQANAAAIVKVGRHLPRLVGLCAELGLVERATYVAHATRADQVVRPLCEYDPNEPAPYFSMLLIAAASQSGPESVPVTHLKTGTETGS